MAKRKNGIANGVGQAARADKADRGMPPVREQNASEEGHADGADQASRELPPHSQPNAEGLSQRLGADKATVLAPAPPRHSDDPRIQQIMALARDRTYWMQMRLRNTARLAAEIRRHLQPTRGQEEEWNESVKTEALNIVRAAVDREVRELKNLARVAQGRKPLATCEMPDQGHHGLATAPFVVRTARALADWQMEEDRVLDEMQRIAGTLPIASFVDDPERKGFTLAGLAVIIGHAGHPLDYPKKGHLWKRLGLAPYAKDGVTRAGSSWGRFGGLDKNDWIALGYKRSRLGDLFGKITQPLLYAQWRSTGAIGPYGESYGRYKARQKELNEGLFFVEEAQRQAASAKRAGKKPQKALLEGKLPDSAINARALRYMTKKLIADLWFAWRRLEQLGIGDKPADNVSTAAESIERKATVPTASEPSTYLPTAQPVGTRASQPRALRGQAWNARVPP